MGDKITLREQVTRKNLLKDLFSSTKCVPFPARIAIVEIKPISGLISLPAFLYKFCQAMKEKVCSSKEKIQH